MSANSWASFATASAEYVASANFIDQTINTSSPRPTPTLTPPRRVNVTPARDPDTERRREMIEERLNIAEEQSLNLLGVVDHAHREATTMQWFIELQALTPPWAGIDAGEPLQDLQTRFLPFIYTLSAGLVGLCIFSGCRDVSSVCGRSIASQAGGTGDPAGAAEEICPF